MRSYLKDIPWRSTSSERRRTPPAAPSGLSPSRGVVALTGSPLPTFWIGRAVDQDGVVLEEILQKRRDKREAKRLLVSLMKRCGFAP